MGIAHFFYGDWDTEDASDAAQEALIKACVAFENECVCTDAAQSITSGYRDVWIGACTIVHDASDEHFDPRYFDTPADAEKFYRKAFLKAYLRTVRRSYPKYETDGDGLGWWPECLKLSSRWPQALLRELAFALGAIEADRTVAASRYYEQQQAEQVSASE